ncbi:zinc finger BED domain-containing protein RICESLEEPER 1-like [Tasmannia lanceolata]|uniref:zinc finger BED domain-containing protein RICESLEEPER 1-like n=1 Tax=Tasmannia lanceolata TaxID=3420 RepID=UPI004062993F
MSEVSDNGNNGILEASSSSLKNRRLTSIVWEDFTRISCEDGSKRARCEHCKMMFTCKVTSGTSHLKRHLGRCPKYKNKDRRLLSLALLASTDENAKIFYSKFDQDRSRQELAKMIILHEYPFYMVEHLGFISFVKSLQPQFEMVTHNTVMGDCLEIFHKEKQNLKELLNKTDDRISLTSNMWTCNENFGYMSLAACFIDNEWKLQKRILNFKLFNMVEFPHLENALTDSILMCILDWNIERKLSTITMDNCYTNDTISSNLREYFVEKNILLLNGQLFHIPCCTSILNSIVQDELDEIRETIHKVRESVKYVKASHACQQKFDEVVQEVQVESKKSLCLDVQTKWNSTYLMLEGALKFREAFSCLETQDSSYKDAPSIDDWNSVEAICMFLKVFYNATDIFSKTKCPTSNLYFPELWKILAQLTQQSINPDTLISTIAKRMQQKFDKYWKDSCLLLATAVVMDPRFKMKLVEYCFSKIYGNDAHIHIKIVHEGIHDLYNEFVNYPNLACMTQDLVDNVKVEIVHLDGTDGLQEYDLFVQEQATCRRMMSELDQYLDEPVFPRNLGFDILGWWKLNTHKYPTLSKMARDILAIPVSTVASESIFSNGRVLDQYRSSLLPETIEALICTQDWLQNAPNELVDVVISG